MSTPKKLDKPANRAYSMYVNRTSSKGSKPLKGRAKSYLDKSIEKLDFDIPIEKATTKLKGARIWNNNQEGIEKLDTAAINYQHSSKYNVSNLQSSMRFSTIPNFSKG